MLNIFNIKRTNLHAITVYTKDYQCKSTECINISESGGLEYKINLEGGSFIYNIKSSYDDFGVRNQFLYSAKIDDLLDYLLIKSREKNKINDFTIFFNVIFSSDANSECYLYNSLQEIYLNIKNRSIDHDLCELILDEIECRLNQPLILDKYKDIKINIKLLLTACYEILLLKITKSLANYTHFQKYIDDDIDSNNDIKVCIYNLNYYSDKLYLELSNNNQEFSIHNNSKISNSFIDSTKLNFSELLIHFKRMVVYLIMGIRGSCVISNMPIKAYSHNKYGMFITPLLNKIISDVINFNNVFAINNLNSYNKKSDENISNLLNEYQDYGGAYTTFYLDSSKKGKVCNLIYSLLQSDYITVSERNVIICSCGKVEELEENLLKVRNLKISDFKDKKQICSLCGSKLIRVTKSVLLFKYKDIDLLKYNIYPKYFNKALSDINKNYKDNDRLVSKLRATSIEITVNNVKYNIDIDFYLQLLPFTFKKEFLIVSSTHKQVIENYLLLNFCEIFHDTRISVIAYPYGCEMKNNESISIMVRKLGSNYKKLLSLIFSAKINQKEFYYDLGIFKYLSKMSDSDAKDLYNFIVSDYFSYLGDNVHLIINEITERSFNLNKIIKKYKDKHHENKTK
ncbi:hypothetical protein A4A71_08345 [Nicoletella semolina]|uniref:hypothetical protein n=1 Tax=Nicoletella semolina TaxID=271160 RepID=UPI001043FEED|nr:hypothetical protein [Nicoletella semolina]MDH2925325.1 hypothetical protein [Nicoletella semolina]